MSHKGTMPSRAPQVRDEQGELNADTAAVIISAASGKRKQPLQSDVATGSGRFGRAPCDGRWVPTAGADVKGRRSGRQRIHPNGVGHPARGRWGGERRGHDAARGRWGGARTGPPARGIRGIRGRVVRVLRGPLVDGSAAAWSSSSS